MKHHWTPQERAAMLYYSIKQWLWLVKHPEILTAYKQYRAAVKKYSTQQEKPRWKEKS